MVLGELAPASVSEPEERVMSDIIDAVTALIMLTIMVMMMLIMHPFGWIGMILLAVLFGCAG